jgi:hypothetical protein
MEGWQVDKDFGGRDNIIIIDFMQKCNFSFLSHYYAAYKNTTGESKIFNVIFNEDGKSKQSFGSFL